MKKKQSSPSRHHPSARIGHKSFRLAKPVESNGVALQEVSRRAGVDERDTKRYKNSVRSLVGTKTKKEDTQQERCSRKARKERRAVTKQSE